MFSQQTMNNAKILTIAMTTKICMDLYKITGGNLGDYCAALLARCGTEHADFLPHTKRPC